MQMHNPPCIERDSIQLGAITVPSLHISRKTSIILILKFPRSFVSIGIDQVSRSLTHPKGESVYVQTVMTTMFSNWEVCPSTEGTYGQSLIWPIVVLADSFVASLENPSHPCFLDVPLYSSILPSDLYEPFLDGVFAPTSYFDLSAPTTLANATLTPDTTVPSAQLSWSNANSVDPGMIVDSTDDFDMLNPCQMDGTPIDEVLLQCALSVSNRAPRTPSLCSSDGGYCNTPGPGAVTPEQTSPRPSILVVSNRLEKQPAVTNELKRTRGAFKTTNPYSRECVARRAAKSVPSSKVERKRSCNSSEDKATSQIQAKKAHSAVERRYRENINSKIMDLHRTLLATEFGSWSSDVEDVKLLDLKKEECGKIRKSDVLVNAMTYVHQSEIEMRHMSEEIRRLRGQSR
jgi:hypothetical protein